MAGAFQIGQSLQEDPNYRSDSDRSQLGVHDQYGNYVPKEDWNWQQADPTSVQQVYDLVQESFAPVEQYSPTMQDIMGGFNPAALSPEISNYVPAQQTFDPMQIDPLAIGFQNYADMQANGSDEEKEDTRRNYKQSAEIAGDLLAAPLMGAGIGYALAPNFANPLVNRAAALGGSLLLGQAIGEDINNINNPASIDEMGSLSPIDIYNGITQDKPYGGYDDAPQTMAGDIVNALGSLFSPQKAYADTGEQQKKNFLTPQSNTPTTSDIFNADVNGLMYGTPENWSDEAKDTYQDIRRNADIAGLTADAALMAGLAGGAASGVLPGAIDEIAAQSAAPVAEGVAEIAGETPYLLGGPLGRVVAENASRPMSGLADMVVENTFANPITNPLANMSREAIENMMIPMVAYGSPAVAAAALNGNLFGGTEDLPWPYDMTPQQATESSQWGEAMNADYRDSEQYKKERENWEKVLNGTYDFGTEAGEAFWNSEEGDRFWNESIAPTLNYLTAWGTEPGKEHGLQKYADADLRDVYSDMVQRWKTRDYNGTAEGNDPTQRYGYTLEDMFNDEGVNNLEDLNVQQALALYRDYFDDNNNYLIDTRTAPEWYGNADRYYYYGNTAGGNEYFRNAVDLYGNPAPEIKDNYSLWRMMAPYSGAYGAGDMGDRLFQDRWEETLGHELERGEDGRLTTQAVDEINDYFNGNPVSVWDLRDPNYGGWRHVAEDVSGMEDVVKFMMENGIWTPEMLGEDYSKFVKSKTGQEPGDLDVSDVSQYLALALAGRYGVGDNSPVSVDDLTGYFQHAGDDVVFGNTDEYMNWLQANPRNNPIKSQLNLGDPTNWYWPGAYNDNALFANNALDTALTYGDFGYLPGDKARELNRSKAEEVLKKRGYSNDTSMRKIADANLFPTENITLNPSVNNVLDPYNYYVG